MPGMCFWLGEKVAGENMSPIPSLMCPWEVGSCPGRGQAGCIAAMPVAGFNMSGCGQEPYFPCRNGKCIPQSLVCDSAGVDNCGDGSDQAARPPASCKGLCRLGAPWAGAGAEVWAQSCGRVKGGGTRQWLDAGQGLAQPRGASMAWGHMVCELGVQLQPFSLCLPQVRSPPQHLSRLPGPWQPAPLPAAGGQRRASPRLRTPTSRRTLLKVPLMGGSLPLVPGCGGAEQGVEVCRASSTHAPAQQMAFPASS